jgi:glycosyltransferase involved in cell wall biosynthesis
MGGNAMSNLHKRLAIFLPGLYGGGAERITLNLAAGISRQGYAVDLVLAQAEGPYLAELPDSVRLVELNARHRSGLRTMASFPALVRYLRHARPDALLSALHANIIALWARRVAGIPQRVVISEHNTFSHRQQELPKWYRLPMLRLLRRFYPWANGIVAVSEGVADDLAQVAGIPRDRIQVIYNPVVTPELQAKVKELIEHPWFEPGEPPVVLAVGSLTAQKDFSTLIQAFIRVLRARPARLMILGEGEERPALEALVKRLGLEQNVSFPGFVANPYAYMAQASLFVLSSRWEGLPTVLIEALFCGKPIIATDCPSGPREILRDGQYGKLVPVGDMASLAQAIGAVLDDTTFRPPSESWQPFESEIVTNQYMSTLFGT